MKNQGKNKCMNVKPHLLNIQNIHFGTLMVRCVTHKTSFSVHRESMNKFFFFLGKIIGKGK